MKKYMLVLLCTFAYQLSGPQLIKVTTTTILGDFWPEKYTQSVIRDYPGRQELINYKPSVLPKKIEPVNGHLTAHWKPSDIKDSLVVVSLVLIADEPDNTDPTLDSFYLFTPKLYLESTKKINFENKSVNTLARKLRKGNTTKETLQTIADYVVQNTEFKPEYQGYKASTTLKKGKGNSVDRLHLIVALARAKRIPTRVVGGAIIDDVPRDHKWIEYYEQGKGWLPFDPFEVARSTIDPLTVDIPYLYGDIEYFGPPPGAVDDGSKSYDRLNQFVTYGEASDKWKASNASPKTEIRAVHIS